MRMREYHTGWFSIIGTAVGVAVAAVGGFQRGGVEEAVAWGAGIGALAALMFSGLRFARNDMFHYGVMMILVSRNQDIRERPVPEIRMQWNNLLKDFRVVQGVVNSRD